jgi:bifunctional UDP-N-acetylglucosamine pyrophosphorylase/glucosamine-1-phosphate N-acetyltransferase
VSCQAVILAAGRGTRMRSARPKVLHEVLGEPLLGLALDAARAVGADPITVVVGHGAEAVEERFAGEARFVRQDPPQGTGHALRVARDVFAAHPGSPLLVLSADMPLLEPASLARLLHERARSGAALGLLTGRPADPGGYGRVVRGPGAEVLRVVEARDATPEELALGEVDAGAYAFDVAALLPALERPSPDDAQGEYDLTGLVAVLAAAGSRVIAAGAVGADEVRDVNTPAECADASRRLRSRVLQRLMASGVVVEDPETTWVGMRVEVEPDAVLRPFTLLEGVCRIGAGAVIGPGSRLRDVAVGAGARILDHCVLQECRIGAGAQVGPFSHIRPGTELGEDSRVGNFVELKKTRLGAGSKASHLSYLGDAEIGRDVNIGAGTITCNYDGVLKHPTRIGDGAFIGSDSTLVAPIEVGSGAFVAAGSTLTEDVEPDALALGRARQVVKPGWARRRREPYCGER